jgi:hypothetical protein
MNAFINVADETVPIVQPEHVSDDLQVTTHLANILVADRLPQNLDLAQVARRFYQSYPDAYDFLNIVSIPGYTANRFHFSTRNDVQGIGLQIHNNSGSYGSAGRLQGISRFPIASLFDMAERAGIHELGHQWIAFLDVGGLRPGRPHWPPSTLARGIMGFSIGGQGGQGGNFPFTVASLGGGEYRLDPGDPGDEYNDLELYLMGLLPASSVGSHVVLEDKAPCGGCVYKGTTLTVQDVIAAHGARVPAYPNAPNRFTMATILVSMDRLLSPREMSFFEYMAAHGEATTPVTYSSGFAKGTAKPFVVATGGRGTLVTALGTRK